MTLEAATKAALAFRKSYVDTAIEMHRDNEDEAIEGKTFVDFSMEDQKKITKDCYEFQAEFPEHSWKYPEVMGELYWIARNGYSNCFVGAQLTDKVTLGTVMAEHMQAFVNNRPQVFLRFETEDALSIHRKLEYFQAATTPIEIEKFLEPIKNVTKREMIRMIVTKRPAEMTLKEKRQLVTWAAELVDVEFAFE